MYKIKNKFIKIAIIVLAIINAFNITNNVNAETTIKETQTLINNNEQVILKKVDIDTIGTGPINPDVGMNSTISKIFGVVQYCCMAAAVITIIISGVKYIAAAPDEKADIKKQAIALVIGAVIVFSISTILRIIAGITRQSIK